MKVTNNLLILAVSLSTLFYACDFTSAKKKSYELVEETYHSCVLLKNIKIDTNACSGQLMGVKIMFSLDTRSNEELRSFGSQCNGYEINLKLCNEQCKAIPCNRDSLDSLKRDVCEYNNIFTSLKGDCEFFIPFRDMSTNAGRQALLFNIETFPVKINYKENTPNEIQNVKRLKSTPDSKVIVKQYFLLPQVYKMQVLVKSFETDTTLYNPSNMDTHLFGPGYPDLFWQLDIGVKSIYSSPVSHNSLKFIYPYNTPSFYISEKDNVTFTVYDFDTFSRNDILTNVVGSPFSISHDTLYPSCLAFGKLKKLYIASVILNKK